MSQELVLTVINTTSAQTTRSTMREYGVTFVPIRTEGQISRQLVARGEADVISLLYCRWLTHFPIPFDTLKMVMVDSGGKPQRTAGRSTAGGATSRAPCFSGAI